MGDDKFENERLIKWGWPEDIWFHVDDFSSAHIYVRLPKGQTIDNLPQTVINECCQITKGNSIEGQKQPSVDIVYTPWSNLRKDVSMDTGTIGFFDQKLVKKIRNVSRDREMLHKLEKTRTHVTVDFESLRTDRDKQDMAELKQKRKQEAEARKQKEKEERTENRLKHYEDLKPDKKSTNELRGDGSIQSCRDFEGDFM